MNNKKDTGVWSQGIRYCISDEDIAEYKFGKPEPEKRKRIFNHLNLDKCPDCLLRFKDMRIPPVAPTDDQDDDAPLSPVAMKYVERLKQKFKRPKPPEIPRAKVARGEIWRTSAHVRGAGGQNIGSTPMAYPVLVVDPGDGRKRLDNTIRVMPVSTEIFRANFPLAPEIGPSESHLPFSFIVEVFNEKPMLAGNLVDRLGGLDEHELAFVLQARKAEAETEEKTEPPRDSGYVAWIERELAAAEYLARPVYDLIWGGEDDEPMVLSPLKKAAAGPSGALEDMRPRFLLESENTTIVLLQKKGRVWLRFSSKSETLEAVKIDDRRVDFEDMRLGDIQAELFRVEDMPESLKIKLETSEETYTYHVPFSVEPSV